MSEGGEVGQEGLEHCCHSVAAHLWRLTRSGHLIGVLALRNSRIHAHCAGAFKRTSCLVVPAGALKVSYLPSSLCIPGWNFQLIAPSGSSYSASPELSFPLLSLFLVPLLSTPFSLSLSLLPSKVSL